MAMKKNNRYQKGVIMNTRMQTYAWILFTVLVLGLIPLANIPGILIPRITGQPMPELLVALGLVAQVV